MSMQNAAEEFSSTNCAHTLKCTQASRHTDTHVHTHAYTCTQTHMHIHTQRSICAYVYTHAHRHTCTYAHVTCIHMCTCMCTCMHTYTFRGNAWLPATDLKNQLQETIKCYLYISVFSFQIQTAPTGAIAGTYFTL